MYFEKKIPKFFFEDLQIVGNILMNLFEIKMQVITWWSFCCLMGKNQYKITSVRQNT